MVKLKILNGDIEQLIKKEAYKEFYPHGIGHWLGLDVHDNAVYKKKNKEIKELKEKAKEEVKKELEKEYKQQIKGLEQQLQEQEEVISKAIIIINDT